MPNAIRPGRIFAQNYAAEDPTVIVAPTKMPKKSKASASKPSTRTPARKTTPKSTSKKVKAVVPPAAAPAAAGGAATATAATPGAAEAYQLYLAEAQAIPMAKVVPYRFNPALALANVQTGVAALVPYRVQLATLPAPFDITVLDKIIAIALATVFAAAQVDLRSPGTIAQLRKAAGVSRTLLLNAAIALVSAGLLPAAVVQRIQKGKGTKDVAQDCIDLAQLFMANAAVLAGKSPITADQIATASTVGNQLLAALTPKGAAHVPTNVTHPAAAIRDQFGTLLETYYQQLLRAGMWIWLGDVYNHVPPLNSHAGHKKKAAAPAAPPAPSAPKIT